MPLTPRERNRLMKAGRSRPKTKKEKLATELRAIIDLVTLKSIDEITEEQRELIETSARRALQMIS
jgi:hypothetical protein